MHFIFQYRKDNTFRQHFVNTVKYPYTPKQLHMLSKKCAILLLDAFTKIYQASDQYPLILESSSDGINKYKLLSLGYEITDRHLPRGFVTPKKPNTAVLCDYTHCDSNSLDGKVLACGHGYHSLCLQKSQFKCFICLDYLQGEVKKNINALITSMTKDLGKNEFIDENSKEVDEDNLSNVEEATGDLVITEGLLEQTKKLFLEL